MLIIIAAWCNRMISVQALMKFVHILMAHMAHADVCSVYILYKYIGVTLASEIYE